MRLYGSRIFHPVDTLDAHRRWVTLKADRQADPMATAAARKEFCRLFNRDFDNRLPAANGCIFNVGA